MRKFTVRIDACFNFDIEAETAEDAQEMAEDQFDPGEGYSHITETLVFEEDGVTIADDEDDSEICNGCGRDSLDCSHDPCADVIADRGEEEIDAVQ